MTQINIQIIGNGTVIQKRARIGPAIQLTAIPNSGATFLGWKGLGQSFTSGLSTCNVNPRYSTNVVAVFSENKNPTEYQEVTPNTLNPLQFEHAPELISEKSVINYDPPRIWVDDPTVQVSEVFDNFGRFIDNGDGTITDSDSELMWMNPKKIKKSTISKALQMSVHYAGYDDWRLPSIFELESIMPTNEISPPRNYFSSTINTSLSASGNYYDLIRSDGKRFLVWEKSAKEEHILFVRNINFLPLSQTNSGSGVGTVTIKILNGFKSQNSNLNAYTKGSTVEIKATPNNGSFFQCWHGDVTGTDPHCILTIDSPKSVIAEFQVLTYPLNPEKTGSSEGSITPPSTNATNYPHDSALTLTAAPAQESKFRQWGQPKLWVDDPTIQVSKVFDELGRFIINDDGTVLDQSTSLMWTYKVYPKKVSFSEAVEITKKFAGYADWKIPSIADLQSIMPSGKKFFPVTQSCKTYWSNHQLESTNAVVDDWGRIFNVKEFTSLLRLVRSVPRHPIKVNITGIGSGDVKNFIVIQKDDGTLGKVPRTNNQYPLGTKIEVVAEPDSKSRFLKWSGDASGTDLCYLFTVDGPRSVVAEFELKNYKLTLHTTGSGEGSITPSTTAAEYPHGSVVTLTATPAQGSKFRRWSGDFSSTSPEITITFNDYKTVTAEFVRFFPFAVSTSGNGSGTVKRSTQGNEYEAGSRVELNAIPAHGHRFVQWRGDATGTDPHCTLTIDGSKSVVAEFEVLTYPLTLQITGSGEGSITPSTTAAEYPHGSVVTLTATPAQGSVFRRWGGNASGSSPEKRITFDSGKTVTAEFVRMYSLSVSTKGKNQGVVQRSPETDEYEVGSTVKLRAIPAEGHEFVQWHGAAVGAKPTCSIAMNANKAVTAEFRPLPTFDLKVTHTGSGRGVVLPTNQPYWKGSVVSLVAKANDGCVFDGWGGDAAGLEANCTVTVNANLAITAAFSRVEVPDTDITVVFDSTVLSHADNREVTVFQFIVTNRTDRQIHIDIPLAGYVNLQGEEVEQTAWVKGMISGEKGATLRARTFRKMGLVFERHHLGAVKLGEHLHITVLQSKPAQRLSFAFRCTNASSQTLELVQASVESLAVENENGNENSSGNAKSGETDAQAELTARMQLLEKSLQEALSRLSAPAPAAPAASAAPTQTLPEVLAWLCTQNHVPLAVLRQKLLPLGLMPSALINDVNERAFDVAGEAALNEAADTVTVQRAVLLQVLAVW